MYQSLEGNLIGYVEVDFSLRSQVSGCYNYVTSCHESSLFVALIAQMLLRRIKITFLIFIILITTLF